MASGFPFVPTRISGYDFGAKVPAGGWTGTGSNFGWPVHLGTDFGTPAGEAIIAPFGGTAKFETGLGGYGNRLTERFANGWSLVFGHVAAGVNGAVAPGQQIGVTGRNVGSAQGAVTLVELHDPSGHAVNPDPFIAGLSSGRFGMASGSVSADPNNPWLKALGLQPISPEAQQKLQQSVGLQPIDLNAGLFNVASSINAIPTQIGHGLADFFVTTEENIAEWLKRQTVAFFVAAVVLLVLFL